MLVLAGIREFTKDLTASVSTVDILLMSDKGKPVPYSGKPEN